MAATKENLEHLLDFIHTLCEKEENAWFRDELINSLSNSGFNHEIKKIEKYLKLDGYKIIDYSDIKNENVRNQLFRDSIEMSKYRLGKINNTISFDEFCRYAYLQVEELINYYYNVKYNSDIHKIQLFIKKHNKKYIPKLDIDLNEISSLFKTLAFVREYKPTNKSMKVTIDFLRKIRNELSHRNSYEIAQEDTILSEASRMKIDVSNSYFNFKNSSKKQINLYNEGRYIFLKRQENYHDITKCLEDLKTVVLAAIK